MGRSRRAHPRQRPHNVFLGVGLQAAHRDRPDDFGQGRFTPGGFLRGITTGDLGIEDGVRRPYVLGLNLKLRNGHVLNGAVTARADESGVIPTHGLYPQISGQPPPEHVQARAFVLAQWAELTKQ
jgi:hypothetical protein